MSNSPVALAARNCNIADNAIETLRETVAAEATSGKSAERIIESVNALARAEGGRDMWKRLEQAGTYAFTQGEEFTLADANQVVVDMLSRGVDDTWSGRANDVKRAHYDGMCGVAQKVESIFS